jgi:PAS domain S-box-containing protein
VIRAARSTIAFVGQTLRTPSAAPKLSLWRQTGIVVACVGLATFSRWAIGLWVPGVVPFAPFFPAIAVAALLGGFWPGIWAWALSAVLGLGLFMGEESAPTFTASRAVSGALFCVSAAVELFIASMLRESFWQSQRNAARYRALVDAGSQLVSTFDAKGGVTERQEGWEKLTGMAWPAYAGLGWLDCVHEDDRAIVRHEAMTDAPSQMEVRIWDAQNGEWRWFAVRAVPLFDPAGEVEERIAALVDITERRASRERRELMLGDLRHRLKNFIAVIQSLVNAALPKGNDEVAAFADTFLHRVRTLQSAGDLVMKANGMPVDLGEVVPAALAPFMAQGESRILIEGPPLLLREHTMGGVALACHELATNAAKYGALSTDNGYVTVRWDAKAADGGERVTIEWIERGGPPVSAPTRQGFGTRIVKAALARESEGNVTLDYEPEGLTCRMTFVRNRQPEAVDLALAPPDEAPGNDEPDTPEAA